jgi:ABC-type antimicrobial peptide transport system permease subunit
MRDIRYSTPREDFSPLMFAPIGQLPGATNPTVVVRVLGDPARFAPALEEAIGEVAPTLKVFRMRTLREAVTTHVRRERLLAWISGGFGALALILAAVGLYGVVAYAAEQRTTEMGIRLALGASQSHVRHLLLREVLWLLAAGLSIGAIAIFGLGRLLDSLLFGLSSHDPLTLVLALLVLSSVALLAGYLPARRVASIDPSRTLRRES